MNVGRTANVNLWVKYFNSLKDPPSSKVYSGIAIYRTTLGAIGKSNWLEWWWGLKSRGSATLRGSKNRDCTVDPIRNVWGNYELSAFKKLKCGYKKHQLDSETQGTLIKDLIKLMLFLFIECGIWSKITLEFLFKIFKPLVELVITRDRSNR